MLAFAGIAQAQSIAIPDANFMARLLESSTSNTIAQDNMGNNIKIDANGDGEISVTEALNVYFLDISNPDYGYIGPKISNLSAISNFPNLRKLDCAVNQITAIDFIFPGSLWTLDCHSNLLTALDIPSAPQLQDLDCGNNQITVARTVYEMLGNPDFQDSSINVFPNPTKNIVNIQSSFNIKSVSLYDIQGRILETSIENETSATIDLSGRQTGMYIFKITGEKGTKVMKVIRE